MKEKRGGKDKNSVSEEWYDKGFVKDRLMENKKIGRAFIQTAYQNTKAGLLQWKPEKETETLLQRWEDDINADT